MYYFLVISLIKFLYIGVCLIGEPLSTKGQSLNFFESYEDYAYDKYKVSNYAVTIDGICFTSFTSVQLLPEQINLDNQMDNLPGGGFPIFINYVSYVTFNSSLEEFLD